MDSVTAGEVRAWRRAQGITQEKLGELLGLSKIAITKIEGGQRQIGPAEQKLLQLLMHGRYPFSTPATEARETRLEFNPAEWELVHRCALREGYPDAKHWIVEKIRSYLRMNPQTQAEQLAAEDPADYNRKEV